MGSGDLGNIVWVCNSSNGKVIQKISLGLFKFPHKFAFFLFKFIDGKIAPFFRYFLCNLKKSHNGSWYLNLVLRFSTALLTVSVDEIFAVLFIFKSRLF